MLWQIILGSPVLAAIINLIPWATQGWRAKRSPGAKAVGHDRPCPPDAPTG